jgi:hypothetical protein
VKTATGKANFIGMTNLRLKKDIQRGAIEMFRRYRWVDSEGGCE